MIEANVIRYSKSFLDSMSKGGWDLSKVNYDDLRNSLSSKEYVQFPKLFEIKKPGVKLGRESLSLSG